MENEKSIITQEAKIPTISGTMFLNMQKFEFCKEVAKMLATSTMLPPQFQGPPGVANCMILLNLAERMRVDAFMLAQNMYIVHGRPGIEAKLAIALFNENSKLFVPPIQWEVVGKDPRKEDYRVRAFAPDKKDPKIIRHGTWIDYPMIRSIGWYSKPGPDKKAESNFWHTMPEQMFYYRSAMFFIKQYEPGVLLGIQSVEELRDIIDISPEPERTIKVDTATGEIVGDPYKIKAANGKKDPEPPPEEVKPEVVKKAPAEIKPDPDPPPWEPQDDVEKNPDSYLNLAVEMSEQLNDKAIIRALMTVNSKFSTIEDARTPLEQDKIIDALSREIDRLSEKGGKK